MDSGEIESVRDKYVIWPSLAATLILLLFFWRYYNYAIVIFVVGFLFILAIGIIGLTKLPKNKFRNATSYILPTILFFILGFSSPFSNFRVQLSNLRDHIRFSFEKQKYEAEVKKMENSGIKYKEWKWGVSGRFEYSLVYDVSDQIVLQKLNPSEPCSRTVRKIGIHFYVVDEYCPSII
jgi:energy-coupling factor transporter transmembrane protein EcfT